MSPQRFGNSGWHAWIASGAIATVVGLLLGHAGPTVALGVLVAPALVAMLVLRPAASFPLLAGLSIAVPYYLAVGSQQAAAFRLEAAGVLVASVLFMLYTHARPRFAFVDCFVLAFLLSTFISWAVFGGSLKTTINTVLPISFYVGARFIGRTRIWQLLWAILIAGAVGAATVLYEGLIVGSAVFVSPDQYLWNANGQALFRPGGVFASPPGAVTVLTMAALCGFAVTARARGVTRTVAVVLTLVCLAGAIGTFTRAGYIGFALGGIAYILLAKSAVLTPKRFFLLSGVAAVLFATLVLPSLSSQNWFQQGVLRQGNLAIRESYWALAEPLITDSTPHLLVGHGVDSLVSQSSSGGPGVGIGPGLATAPTLTTIGPHSQYVRLLLEQGLVGLLLVAGWIGGAAAAGIARVRRVPDQMRPALGALVGATVSFLTIASAGDSMRHPPSLALIALVSGMLVTLREATLRRRDGAEGVPR